MHPSDRAEAAPESLFRLLGLAPDPRTGPPSRDTAELYRPEDAGRWMLDQVRMVVWHPALQGEPVVERVQLRWHAGRFRAFRRECLADLEELFRFRRTRAWPGQPRGTLHLDPRQRNHVRYVQSLGGPADVSLDGTRRRPDVNLRAHVGLGRRQRQRHDLAVGRPLPRGKPNTLQPEDIDRCAFRPS